MTKFADSPSPFGLVDLSGNVWEWCMTDYRTGKNEMNMRSEMRVIRGGAWNLESPDFFRADFRSWLDPQLADNSFGFRICRS